ncbi:MAG: diguanylate cyclase [Deltaproteobacteria bacterium]|nr:diguanylate cyclase [Deltaproteobacteria bacterium]
MATTPPLTRRLLPTSAALRRAGLYAPGEDPALSRFARVAVRVTRAHAAAITLLDDEQVYVKGHAGLAADVPVYEPFPHGQSPCADVVATASPQLICALEPGAEPPVHGLLGRLGMASYAGVPIPLRHHGVSGALSVLHREPRSWTEDEISLLTELAASVGSDLELRVERAALDAATVRMSTMIDSLPAAVLVEDDSRHIHQVNARFCALFSVPLAPEALVGLDCAGAAEQSKGLFVDPEAFVQRIEQLLRARLAVHDDLLQMVDGRWLERDYLPIYVGGAYSGHMWMYRDVTERERSKELLRQQSLIDELTGLYNRRGFLTLAEQQHRLAERQRRPLQLLFADQDDLKQVNDRHGHAAGDRALREIARALRSSLRGSDIVARIGGDEFAALLVESTDGRRAVERFEELLDKLNAAAALPFRLAVSVGLAAYDPSNPETIEALLGRADVLMYERKRSRRPGTGPFTRP